MLTIVTNPIKNKDDYTKRIGYFSSVFEGKHIPCKTEIFDMVKTTPKLKQVKRRIIVYSILVLQ